jgi:hypothetical protein
MGNQPKVITGPLAILKCAGVRVGKAKDIRVEETWRRADVIGLGQLLKDEVPVVGWDGSTSMGFYNIDLRESMIPSLINRGVADATELTAYMLLQEVGITLDILWMVKTGTKPNGAPIYDYRTYCTIKYLFLTGESFNISEGQVSGRDLRLVHTEPITVP